MSSIWLQYPPLGIRVEIHPELESFTGAIEKVRFVALFEPHDRNRADGNRIELSSSATFDIRVVEGGAAAVRDYLLQALRGFLHEVVCHEVDEMIIADGRRYFDPHPGGVFAEAPALFGDVPRPPAALQGSRLVTPLGGSGGASTRFDWNRVLEDADVQVRLYGGSYAPAPSPRLASEDSEAYKSYTRSTVMGATASGAWLVEGPPVPTATDMAMVEAFHRMPLSREAARMLATTASQLTARPADGTSADDGGGDSPTDGADRGKNEAT